MKVNVNLFKPSGKWAYGGVVELSEQFEMWNDGFKAEVLANQDFVARTAFYGHTVVITHREDYDTDPSHYFCQGLWAPGTFY